MYQDVWNLMIYIDAKAHLESTLCDMLVAGSGDDLGEEEDDERTYVPDGWMLTWRETVLLYRCV